MSTCAIMLNCIFRVKPEYVNEVNEKMHSIKFDPQIDERGIFDIGFYGDLCTDETFTVLCAVAPYVEDDSYIEMLGDGLWRWVFNNGECKVIYPDIRWDTFCSGEKRVIIVVERGIVSSVITNDPNSITVDILDRDYNENVCELGELQHIKKLEREIKEGLADETFKAIY